MESALNNVSWDCVVDHWGGTRRSASEGETRFLNGLDSAAVMAWGWLPFFFFSAASRRGALAGWLPGRPALIGLHLPGRGSLRSQTHAAAPTPPDGPDSLGASRRSPPTSLWEPRERDGTQAEPEFVPLSESCDRAWCEFFSTLSAKAGRGPPHGNQSFAPDQASGVFKRHRCTPDRQGADHGMACWAGADTRVWSLGIGAAANRRTVIAHTGSGAGVRKGTRSLHDRQGI